MKGRSSLWKEIPDQAAHFAWAVLTVLLLVVGWRQLGQNVVVALVMIGGGLASLSILIGREIRQKADKPGGILWNWPWLDSTFYVLGAAAGVGIGVGFL